MTFFNHLKTINININHFCSGFGDIFSACTPNLAFMNNSWLTNFNFRMPIFNNFNCFNSSFTSFPLFYSSPMNSSLWNNVPTMNMQTINFNNFGWNNTGCTSFNFNNIPLNWGISNCDTFNYTKPSSSGSGKKRNTGQTWEYCSLSRQSALTKASSDPKLEKLSGGTRWKLSSFRNDIPYAGKGTTAFLNNLCNEIGENLTITSALGTSGSPHVKGSGYESHYNSNNPKLDIGGGLSPSKANALAAKLRKTGYFSRVEVEKDGSTAHLDVQIKASELKKYANTATA